MEIKVDPSNDVTVVEIRGRIIEGEPAGELDKALRGLIRDERVNTILDVSDVSWFDSTAIGILVSHYVSAKKLGGRVLLLKANQKVKTLMKLVHLDERFGWADEMDEALSWFENSAS